MYCRRGRNGGGGGGVLGGERQRSPHRVSSPWPAARIRARALVAVVEGAPDAAVASNVGTGEPRSAVRDAGVLASALPMWGICRDRLSVRAHACGAVTLRVGDPSTGRPPTEGEGGSSSVGFRAVGTDGGWGRAVPAGRGRVAYSVDGGQRRLEFRLL